MITKCHSGLKKEELLSLAKLNAAIRNSNVDKKVRTIVDKQELVNLKKHGIDPLEINKNMLNQMRVCDHCIKVYSQIMEDLENYIKVGFCLLSGLFEKDIRTYAKISVAMASELKSTKQYNILKEFKNVLSEKFRSEQEIIVFFEDKLKLCLHCQEIEKESIIKFSKKK